MTLTKEPLSTQAISVTNFDLSSLYLLRPEITVTLKNAERHLSEFNDNEEQAPLLLDSVAMLKQLAEVLKLISLSGGGELAELLSESMQRLYDIGENTNEPLILATSQAIMTLSRYIEFVLLYETLEPSLLLPVINQLNEVIGKQPLSLDNLITYDYSHVSLANPAQNFKSLASLDLDTELLSTVYRTGLNVILASDNDELDAKDSEKLNAMYQSCAHVAEKSDSLFWKAAAAATYQIQELLPLTSEQKHIFIFLDQQFHNYLPADDKRFADLVSFACLRNHELAIELRKQLDANTLTDSQRGQLRQFMFGPDQDITNTLNNIIQKEVSDIKSQVSNLVYDNNVDTGSAIKPDDMKPIVAKLKQLASTMRMLSLNNAAKELDESALIVGKWTTPNLSDLDALLNRLMTAENAAINLSKAHTPGSQIHPFNNENISIFQLDTAYHSLVDESRKLLSLIEHSISNFMDDITNPNKDVDVLKDVPGQLKQVAGALSFLELTDAANVINRLSNYMSDALYIDHNIIENDDNANYRKYAKVADVILAVDHTLSALQKNHPVGNHAMNVGNESLNKLMTQLAA